LIQQPEEMILCTFTEMDQVFFITAGAQQLYVLIVVPESNKESISKDPKCTILLQQRTIHDGNHTPSPSLLSGLLLLCLKLLCKV
jgi:hypothetical protein